MGEKFRVSSSKFQVSSFEFTGEEETVVETIFQELGQDDALGPVLAEREGSILARIEARLAE